MNLPETLKNYPIDHIGIAVHDLEEASQAYFAIGLPQVGEDEIVSTQNVKVRALQAGDSLVELLEPTHEDSPIAKFLAKKGSGLHHLALGVSNLEAEIERLIKEDAQFISTEVRAGRAGTRVVFLHPRWSQGVLIELVQHA